MQKEYEQNARTPLTFSADKTCFMEGTPSSVFFCYLMTSHFPINATLYDGKTIFPSIPKRSNSSSTALRKSSRDESLAFEAYDDESIRSKKRSRSYTASFGKRTTSQSSRKTLCIVIHRPCYHREYPADFSCCPPLSDDVSPCTAHLPQNSSAECHASQRFPHR